MEINFLFLIIFLIFFAKLRNILRDNGIESILPKIDYLA